MGRVTAALAVAVLVAGGCSESGGADSNGGSPPPPLVDGEELPVVITEEPLVGDHDDLIAEINAALGERPPEDATVTEQLLHELQRETILLAEFMGETSAECEGGQVIMEEGATSTCTVRYESVTVSWEVDIVGNRSGPIAWYRIEPQQVVVRAAAVYDMVWQSPPGEQRCSEVPDIGVVEFGADTGYRCQFFDPTIHDSWQTCSVISDDDPLFEGALRCAQPDIEEVRRTS